MAMLALQLSVSLTRLLDLSYKYLVLLCTLPFYVINITAGLISFSLLSLLVLLTGPETDYGQGGEDAHHHVEHDGLVVHHTQHYSHCA